MGITKGGEPSYSYSKKQSRDKMPISKLKTKPLAVVLAAEKMLTGAAVACKSRQKTTVTPFQHRVYLALCQVPQGQVTTYKEIGLSIDCKSAQAVGQALRRNPWAPHVPCHRVVATNLSMGGFFGKLTGPKLEEKRALLLAEGVLFQEKKGKGGGCAVDPSCVYRFDSTEQQVD